MGELQAHVSLKLVCQLWVCTGLLKTVAYMYDHYYYYHYYIIVTYLCVCVVHMYIIDSTTKEVFPGKDHRGGAAGHGHPGSATARGPPPLPL